MTQYLPKAAVVAEIENLLDKGRYHEEYDCAYRDGNNGALYALKGKLNTLEVKEIKLPSPRFPHLNNIVDKVFGTGNLESLEYEEAEQLVLLAKEELLKDLEVREVDLDKEIRRYRMKNPIIQHREESLYGYMANVAKHFFELGLKAQKEDNE